MSSSACATNSAPSRSAATATKPSARPTPTYLYGMQLEDDRRTISNEGRCLYDLTTDPYEQHNLADTESALEQELSQRLSTWNAETPWLET